MKAAFWLSLAIVLYTYAGYPVVIWALGRLFGKKPVVENSVPSASIVMAVRNGVALLDWKIQHLLNLDYPNIREIIVVSDGSTDGTEELLASQNDSRLKVILLPEHRGKAAALNAGVAVATAEVILFVDLRPEIAPGAIGELVSHFADPTVGCVAGELVLSKTGNSAVTGSVSGLYWRYEQWIRNSEAKFDSAIGVYGGFYAILRRLFMPHPEGMILDDIFQPLSIVRQGYRSVIAPGAQVFDSWPQRAGSEFSRKVRTLAGNFQLMKRAPWILTLENRTVFQFISHKLLRLVVPYLFLVLLASSGILSKDSLVYATLFALQAAGWLLAAIGLRFRIPVLDRITGPAGALLLLNAAAVLGLYKFVQSRGSLWQIWDPKGTEISTGCPVMESVSQPKHT